MNDRIEAFPEGSPPPAVTCQATSNTMKNQHNDLEDSLSVFKNRQNPTPADREFLWDKVFYHYEQQLAPLPDSPAGNRERCLVRASLLLYLFKAFPPGTLCDSQASLRRRFDEKLRQWRERGRNSAALRYHYDNCGRKAKKLCPTCRPLMIGATVDFDKDYRQAWRRLHVEGKFCDTCQSAWLFDAKTNKSYCPRSVIEDIRGEVDMAWSLRKGPKYRRLTRPFVRRDWSDTPPGIGSVMDDMTPDHAIFGAVELPLACGRDHFRRPFVGRVEALFSVDERTDFPLAFIFILGDPATSNSPQRKASYNQIHQRKLLLHQHDTIGLPHRGGWLKLENGPWRNRMLDGEDVRHWGTLGVASFENGLAEMGIRIRRTMPGNPRAKIIERVFHTMQSRGRCQRGFLGNNERLYKPEALQDFISQVKRGKEDPRNELLEVTDYEKLLSNEFMAFAEEEQKGERLPGVSPKDAFYNGIDGHPGYTAKPMQQFAANARFLLSTHEKEVRVGPQGILYKLAGHSFPFWGPEFEPYRGNMILARFNIEQPELLACRAADGKTFNVKARIQMANTEPKEQMAQTAKDCASWMDGVVYSNLPHPFRYTVAKGTAHSRDVLQYGAEYQAELAKAKTKKSAADRKLHRALKAAEAQGVSREFAEQHPDRILQGEEMRREMERLRREEGKVQ